MKLKNVVYFAFMFSVLFYSCGLDPKNPKDANLIFNLLQGAEQLNAALTKDVSIITDIRGFAISSDAFDQSELLLYKSGEGEAVFSLILTYAPCFENNKDEKSRIYALERTFANFSFLESHEPIKDFVMDDGTQVYSLTKSDNPVGMVMYPEGQTFVYIPTGKKYDEFVRQDAIEPGRDADLHMFNFENIVNQAHDGYCQFMNDNTIYLKDIQDEGNTYKLSCDVRVAIGTGSCGTKIQHKLIPKSTVLSVFRAHNMYSVKQNAETPVLYDIFYKDGVKRGFFLFNENDRLLSILAVTHSEYIFPEKLKGR